MAILLIGNTSPPAHLERVEAIVGEVLASDATLTIASVPSAGAAVANGTGGFVLSLPGSYKFVVGGLRAIEILCFEPALLGMIPSAQNHGRVAPRSAQELRLILRSYANTGANRSGLADATRTSRDWESSFVR